MVVFGGLLIPSETFTDLLWTYDFSSGLWELIPTARGNNSFSITTVSMEFNNDTEFSGDNDTSDSNDTIPWGLPLPVRGHTAHVIGNKMVVFFGLAYAAELFPSAIQELDLGKYSACIVCGVNCFEIEHYGVLGATHVFLF